MLLPTAAALLVLSSSSLLGVNANVQDDGNHDPISYCSQISITATDPQASHPTPWFVDAWMYLGGHKGEEGVSIGNTVELVYKREIPTTTDAKGKTTGVWTVDFDVGEDVYVQVWDGPDVTDPSTKLVRELDYHRVVLGKTCDPTLLHLPFNATNLVSGGSQSGGSSRGVASAGTADLVLGTATIAAGLGGLYQLLL